LLSEQGDVKFDMMQKQRDGEPLKNNKKGFKMDYSILKNNPSPKYIANVLKNSEGFFGDNEAWAQAAFEAIKDRKVYDEVSSLLGDDAYNFVKGFMNTDEEYHTKGKTIDGEFRRISPTSFHFMCNNGMGVKSKPTKFGGPLTIPNHSENCYSCNRDIREYCAKRNMTATLITQKGKYWDEYFLRGDSDETVLSGGHWDGDDYTYCICMNGEERIIDNNVYFIEEGPVFKQGSSQKIDKEVLKSQFYKTRKEIEKMNRGIGFFESFSCSEDRKKKDWWGYQQCVTENLSMAVSVVPVIGTAASAILDFGNGLSYLAHALFGGEDSAGSDVVMAGISFLSVIPGFGEARALLKFPRKSVIATTDMMWTLEKKQFLNMVDAKKYDDAFSILKNVEKGDKYNLSKYGRKEVNSVIDNLKNIGNKDFEKYFTEFQKIVDTYAEGGLKRETLNNIMKKKDFVSLVKKYGNINKAMKSHEFKKMLINMGFQVSIGAGTVVLFNYIEKLKKEIENRNFDPKKEKELFEMLQYLEDANEDLVNYIQQNEELNSDENISKVVDKLELIYDDPSKKYEDQIDWESALKNLDESKYNRKIKISENQFKKLFLINEQSNSGNSPTNTNICTPKFNQVVTLIKPIIKGYNIKNKDKVVMKEYTVDINNETLCRFSFTLKTYDGDELTCIITDNNDYADSSWVLYKYKGSEIASGVYDTSKPMYNYGLFDVDIKGQKQKNTYIFKFFILLLNSLNKKTKLFKKIEELDSFYSELENINYENITKTQTNKILTFLKNNTDCKIYNNTKSTINLYNKFNTRKTNKDKQTEEESVQIWNKLRDYYNAC
jgi:hypothetical protein